MTQQEITNQIDSMLQTYLSQIKMAEDGYFSVYGRYFQGLPTHSVIPSYGNSVKPDQGSLKPYYESQSWNDMGQLSDNMTACMRIDQYLGPKGPGYVIVLQVVIQSVLWQRSVNFDPETDRESSWSSVNVSNN